MIYPVPETRPTLIAPGAERILHRSSWWQVFVAELAPTSGRLQASLRATAAMVGGLLLAAMVGDPNFVICPVTAMTESVPGTLHTPGLLLRRVAMSGLCAALSIGLVVAFPQQPMVLFPAMLLAVGFVLYLTRVLPVGASGLRVAMWTMGPLFGRPLSDPADFERAALLSSLGVCSGVMLAYAAALTVFPGSEVRRARQAVDGLLAESSDRLRDVARRCRESGAGLDVRIDSTSPAVVAHVSVLTQAIATYAQDDAMFPELVPLTRLAAMSDSTSVQLAGLARLGEASPEARQVTAEVADRLAAFFDASRGLAFERLWGRPGDRVPAVEALIAQAESLMDLGETGIRAQGETGDERMLALFAFARRCGTSLRVPLTAAPLPRRFGQAGLALPLGFDPAAPIARNTTLWTALSEFNMDAAMSAAAAVSGVGVALVLCAFLLPEVASPAALGSVFVLQSTIGASSRKGVLRLLGTVIGGVMACLAMELFAWGMQGLDDYALIMGAMAFVSSWVFVGSPRTSYVGMMMAAAWIMAIATDPMPAESVVPAIVRVVSVLIAGGSVSLMIWLFATRSARAAVMSSIAVGWRQLASLLGMASLQPFQDADLRAWRLLSHKATATLAATSDLREQYAFERRLLIEGFQPMLSTLAEQQRSLVMARTLALGRFMESPLPAGAGEPLERSLQGMCARFRAMAEAFERPGVSASEPAWIPSAEEVREHALACGCGATQVARMLYRRDVLLMLQAGLDRAESLRRRGFVWVDGTLHSALEMEDGSQVPIGRADMLARVST